MQCANKWVLSVCVCVCVCVCSKLRQKLLTRQFSETEGKRLQSEIDTLENSKEELRYIRSDSTWTYVILHLYIVIMCLCVLVIAYR